MKSTRFLCLALMIKYTFKTVDVVDWLLTNFPVRVIYNYRVNYKNTVILITIEKSFFLK